MASVMLQTATKLSRFPKTSINKSILALAAPSSARYFPHLSLLYPLYSFEWPILSIHCLLFLKTSIESEPLHNRLIKRRTAQFFGIEYVVKIIPEIIY